MSQGNTDQIGLKNWKWIHICTIVRDDGVGAGVACSLIPADGLAFALCAVVSVPKQETVIATYTLLKYITRMILHRYHESWNFNFTVINA